MPKRAGWMRAPELFASKGTSQWPTTNTRTAATSDAPAHGTCGPWVQATRATQRRRQAARPGTGAGSPATVFALAPLATAARNARQILASAA